MPLQYRDKRRALPPRRGKSTQSWPARWHDTAQVTFLIMGLMAIHGCAARRAADRDDAADSSIQRRDAALQPDAASRPDAGVQRDSAVRTLDGGHSDAGGGGQLSPIAVENARPGTAAWEIPGSARASRQVEGYASTTSAAPKETVQLYVSTDRARVVRWELYRLGFYQGLGGRLVAQGPIGVVTRQPGCPTDALTGMVECHWQSSFSLDIAADLVSGQYLFKLIADEQYQSYVPLVIREAQPRAPVLVQSSVNTWQAYNSWGGLNLYRGHQPPPGAAYAKNEAVRVSFDRPYSAPGVGDLFKAEIFMIAWLEREGFDLAYATNIDVDAEPAQLQHRRLFVSMGHDEYWSLTERAALDAAAAGGVSLAFVVGNSGYWRVRYGASSSGTARRTMTCYRDATLDPVHDAVDTTVRFRDAPHAQPEDALIGEMYEGLNQIDGYPQVVADPSHWIYDGTGVRAGEVLPNIMGQEWDHVYYDSTTPPDVEIVAHAMGTRTQGFAVAGDVSVHYPTAKSLVFAAGSIHWAWGLARDGFADARIQRMMENVFARADVAPLHFTEVVAPHTTPSAAPAPALHVLAGSFMPGYRDGSAAEALFNAPAGVAADADGTLYVSDQRNHRIRKISTQGVVTTLAGSGSTDTMEGTYADGHGSEACFDAPSGIVVGLNGVVYVSDTGNHCIRAVSAGGDVTTFAGACTVSGNSDATTNDAARFSYPRGLALGPDGALFVADSGNARVRRIDGSGVTTVGSGLPNVSGVAVDQTGTIYAVSDDASRIYAIQGGHASVLANHSGLPGDSDGPALRALLRPADGMVVDGRTLVFSDSGNYKLRTLSLVGSPQVATFVGGPSLQARPLHLPRGLALTATSVIVADTGNNRIVAVPRPAP